jgi:hypothetical protein
VSAEVSGLGFKVTPPRSLEERSLIDDFLPHYDFSATYEIRIQAPALVVYQCLLVSDFNDVRIVRVLMTLRSGRRIRRNREPCDLRQRLQGTGFVILAEVPNDELVIGVAGQFWRPDGGRCRDLTADDFCGFSLLGYAKAAWNFKLRAETPESTVLSTETRIQCFGRARWKFRLYWNLVGPFSGLIRTAILRQVKVESESVALTVSKSA